MRISLSRFRGFLEFGFHLSLLSMLIMLLKIWLGCKTQSDVLWVILQGPQPLLYAASASLWARHSAIFFWHWWPLMYSLLCWSVLFSLRPLSSNLIYMLYLDSYLLFSRHYRFLRIYLSFIFLPCRSRYHCHLQLVVEINLCRLSIIIHIFQLKHSFV